MEILRRNKGINAYIEVWPDVTDDTGHYIEQTLKNNTLRTLLPLQMQWIDGKVHLLYKTDGMVSLPRSWTRQGPGREEVQRLLLDLAASIQELQDYLLPPEGLVLSLPYIMMDENYGHSRFLYVTESGSDFSGGMKHLFEEIMPAYQHEKEAEIVWFYDLYGRFLDGSFTPDMLLQMTEEWKENRGGCVSGRKSEGIPVSEYGFDRIDPVPGAGVNYRGRDVRAPDVTGEGTASSSPSGSGRRLAVVGGAVLTAALLLYILLGGSSFLFSAVLAGAYVVFLICELLSEDQKRKKAAGRGYRTSDGSGTPGDDMTLRGSGTAGGYRASERFGGSGNDMTPRGSGTTGEYKASESFVDSGNDMASQGSVTPGGYRISERWGDPGSDMVSDRFDGTGGYRTSDRSGKPGNGMGSDRPGGQEAFGCGKEGGVRKSALRQLIPMETGMQMPLYISEGYCRIGRSAGENEYCIPAPSISRNHARLECSGEVVTLQDLGSTNGTYLNHVRLDRECAAELHYGDVVSFAGEEFYVV